MVARPKQILWPTDFSPLSLVAAQYARDYRDVFGARLHVLHVSPPPLSADISINLPADLDIEQTRDELISACRTKLEELVAAEFPTAGSVRTEVRVGAPWSLVCDYADEHGIDLIIVATHGRAGLEHVLIGSTAERIVQHAPCAVLVVKQSGTAQAD